MLAVAKSVRAQADRELVGFGPSYEDRDEAASGQVHSVVSATVDRSGETVRIQIDLVGPGPVDHPAAGDPDRPPASDVDWSGTSFRKVIRVNGAPRRAADLVGEFNAVLFSAQDLELVYGAPTLRRRYLDVLISQHDRPYLRALQRYQRALTQRNHLLRSIRNGWSAQAELGPWDDRLAQDGGYIVASRIGATAALRKLSAVNYASLSDGAQTLRIDYRASFEPPLTDEHVTPKGASEELGAAIERSAGRDVAQGHTCVGPHRDDMEIHIDGVDASRYASRGQARTAILSLKFAEAEYLSGSRGETPVILLDDVLSELDPRRRELVLDRVSAYDQCLLTTAELGAVAPARRSQMNLYRVQRGAVLSD